GARRGADRLGPSARLGRGEGRSYSQRAMCGICGIAQVGGPKRKVVEADVLSRMTDVMTHRGPNDRGLYFAPGVALGVRRLSIVDVEGGHQPVESEDRRVAAVPNGGAVKPRRDGR